MKTIVTILLSLLCILSLTGQDSLETERRFRKMDLLPAISYAPETQLTLGVIGFRYFDLYRGDPKTKLSNISFLAVYTTANQVSFRGVWDVFTDGNRWRFRGLSFFDIYPDRNYGRGNEAGALVVEYDEKTPDTLNYLRYTSKRLNFSPIALRRVSPTLYLGLRGDMEYLFDEKVLPDDYQFVNADSTSIQDLPLAGLRAGLGLQATFDNRANVINPISGTFVELSTLHFGPWVGSDFTFHSLLLDARCYVNPWRNHTLALRGVVNFRFPDDPIPMRALSRVGGREFLRGYFFGTYQDNHLLAFEAEYRLPFWKEEVKTPFWKIWKRLGIVGFIGGARVFPDFDRAIFSDFRLAAGGGLRVLFNPESRLNIRIDYALALAPDSAGPGSRQSGFYFFLGEAF